MKKKLLIALAIFISAYLCITRIIPFTIFALGSNEYFYFDDFKSYKSDFEILIEKMLSLDNLPTSGDGQDVYINQDSNHNYKCLINKTELDLTPNEEESLENIQNVLSGSHAGSLYRIIVYKGKVIFRFDGNLYAIAYTKDNKPPKSMGGPNENKEIRTKKIENNWYHIVSK